MKTRTLLNQQPGNCGPTALWLIGDHSEETVLEVCTQHGFNQDVRGMHLYDWIKAARALGFDLQEVCVEAFAREDRWQRRLDMTLSEFCRRQRTGVYCVAVASHILVVNHGVVVDPNIGTNHMRRRVRRAFLVANTTMKPAAPPRVAKDPLIMFVNDTYIAHPKKWNDKQLQFDETGITQRYAAAVKVAGLGLAIRLSAVLRETNYRRADFLYDLRHGNITLISREE